MAREFEPQTMDWQDIFGDGMTAQQVVQSAKNDGTELSAWLSAQYFEMERDNHWNTDDAPSTEDFERMARQIKNQA